MVERERPFALYLRAQDAYRAGDHAQAVEQISLAMGASHPLPLVKQALADVFVVGSPVNNLVLDLLAAESRRRA